MKRRDFLRMVGLTSAASGLSPLVLKKAFADGLSGGAPKRLIVLSSCHGWTYDGWKMRPEGLSENETWEVNLAGMRENQFSQVLAPLFPHRQRMLALDGLSLATAELDLDGYRHQKGWIQAWTGNWAYFTGTELGSQSPSLDQFVASRIASSDRLPSIEISVDAGGPELGRPINHTGHGLPLPMENSPQKLWQRLFGPSQSPDPLSSRQGSVLDYARAEYKALANKLGTADRQKLDIHFDLLRGLSERIEGMSNLSCSDIPLVGTTDGFSDYEQTFDAFAELVAASFACDITRVASMSLGDMPSSHFGWGDVTDDVHKGLAHEIYNNNDAHEAMTVYMTYHARQIARLVSLLESIPDSDGNSVMDNTLIIWGSEMANGWHGYLNYCPVLIGGSWHFNTGRYMHWPHETPVQLLAPQGYTQVAGKPHQHLLTSVSQAMGIDTNQFGITKVESRNGARLDLTGPLPGLT